LEIERLSPFTLHHILATNIQSVQHEYTVYYISYLILALSYVHYQKETFNKDFM